MNGNRVATNGDIRLEPTPGQWQPVPKKLKREIGDNYIITTLCYPDSARHMQGFNPMIYPNLNFKYTVKVQSRGKDIEILVNLDKPIPQEYAGKIGFNIEFFPGSLFGKPWIMDNHAGIYPQQPNSPLYSTTTSISDIGNYYTKSAPKANIERLIGKGYSPIAADDVIALPYAEGKKFTSCPDDPYNRVTIESFSGNLKLYDGRMNHNNGWFVLRSEISTGITEGAVRWIITPNVVNDWKYKPVIQTSQIGYHPNQEKIAIIECDKRDVGNITAKLMRIDSDGAKEVKEINPEKWGNFLRYRYLRADFSDITVSGLYQVIYGNSASPIFKIDKDLYERGVWQPVIEYFLPVQMCHMRVNEKYRVWHEVCHMDDAKMAQSGGHIDGYVQPENSLCKYKAGDRVDGLNVGGWHDAGDFDLRVESQSSESYILALAYENFHPEIDVTSIDHQKHITEIHQPDGKNDMLQQIENGLITVIAGYKNLGRLYRGIICKDLRQYVLLGDASAMTDGIAGNDDDRWVFTEDNPFRELQTAAALSAASRTMRQFNDTLSRQSLEIAAHIYDAAKCTPRTMNAKIHAATELYLTTKNNMYLDFILSNQESIIKDISNYAWFVARIENIISQNKDRRSKAFCNAFRNSLKEYRLKLETLVSETPYGVPYRPNIWGAGWDIQSFGMKHFFLVDAYPDIFSASPIYNALNFVLGCHPGSNQASFASGVGAKSATVGYGLNRADWSYIPGGVISGTALIRPDFPELLTFPYLWQQTEYVLGGGSSNYMFLVLAANKILNCAK